MASSIALRRASTSRFLFPKLLRPASASASYNTNAPVVDVDRRPDRSVTRRRDTPPSFFPDVFDPFSPSRSLYQVMNLMDRFMDNPLVSPVPRRGWEAKEDDDALTLKIDMPGLSKEDVKISVQQNTLIIKGEAKKESGVSGGDGDGGDESGEAEARRYSSRIELAPGLYKIDEIKAEMKNGVLKIVVPKVKGEETKDVFQVNVE